MKEKSLSINLCAILFITFAIFVPKSNQQSQDPPLCNANFVYTPSTFRCEEIIIGGPPGIADTLPQPDVPMGPIFPGPLGPPFPPLPTRPPPPPDNPTPATPPPPPPETPAPTLPPQEPAAETTAKATTTATPATPAPTTAPAATEAPVTTASTSGGGPATEAPATTAAPGGPATAAPAATTVTTAAAGDTTKAVEATTAAAVETTKPAADATTAPAGAATTAPAGGGTLAPAGEGEEEAGELVETGELVLPLFVEGLFGSDWKGAPNGKKAPSTANPAIKGTSGAGGISSSKGPSTAKGASSSYATRLASSPVVGFRSTPVDRKGRTTPRDVERIDPKEQATTPKLPIGKYRFPRQVDSLAADAVDLESNAFSPPAFVNIVAAADSTSDDTTFLTSSTPSGSPAGPPIDFFAPIITTTSAPSTTTAPFQDFFAPVVTTASTTSNFFQQTTTTPSTTVTTHNQLPPLFITESVPTGTEEYCLECDDSPPHLSKLCDFNDGAFINACGKCVEGRTGLPATLGLNLCGHCANPSPNECVGQCFASNITVSMDNCGRCLPVDGANRDQCVSITRALPSLIDRCVTKQQNVVLTLTGAGLNMQSLAGVECSLTLDGKEVSDGVLRATPRESSLDVEIGVPQRQGRYKINCREPRNELVSTAFVNVVDSGALYVTKLHLNTFSVGAEVQLNATVPRATANHRLLCALWSRKGLITMVPALADQGSVKCGRIQMTSAGRFQLRVVASEYAAITKTSCAMGGEVVVQAMAPILISSLLSPDLRAIWFDFDQSVEGPSECDKIFSPPSLKLLGQGVACEFAGARLVAKLGKKPAILSGGKVQIVVENGIRQAGTVDADAAQTLTGVFASVTLHPAAVAVPRYRIIPSNPTCDASGSSNSVAEIRIVPEDGRELNASVRVAFNGNDIQDQRRNLFLWRTIREIGDQLVQQQKREGGSNRLVINTSLLVPDVEYRITVWATDMMGTKGEEREVLVQTDQQTSKQQPTLLIILGPETARVDLELRAEAKLVTCDPRAAPPAKIKFFWGVMAAGGPLPIQTSQQGRVLRLPPFSMKGGVPHQISCSAYLESDLSNPLATGTLVMLTTTAGVEARVSVAALSIGTNQELVLDARPSTDLDAYPGPLQFAWECSREGSACLVPRVMPVLLRTVYEQEMSKDVLRLPPGALAVGEHTFTLRVSRSSGSTSASSRTDVKVRVLRGSSPSIRLLKAVRQPLDPTTNTEVHALLQSLKGRCWAKWRSAARLTDEVPLDLDQEQPILWEENYEEQSNREIVLNLKAGQLTAGASHRIVLDAACSQTPDKPAMNRASLELELRVATVPTQPTISVTPLFGEALRTVFTISVESEGSATLRSGSEQPGRLIYEFGWREAGRTKTQSLQTSLYDLSAQTLLHCDGGVGECSVVPVVKVCDAHAVCSSSEAAPVRVSKPTAISQYNLDLTANKIEELLEARRIGSAYTLSRGAILTARDVHGAEQAARLFSQRVETSFARTISDMERRLESGNANAMLQTLDGENFSNQHHEPAPLSTIAAALDVFAERIRVAIHSRAPKTMPRRFMANKQSEPSWPNPRRRRKRQQEQNNLSVQEVSKSVREAEEAIFRLSGNDRAEAASLLGHRLGFFLRSLCSSGSTVRARILTLAAATLPQVERLRVPLPRNRSPDDQINNQKNQEEQQAAAYVQVLDVEAETEDDEAEEEACFGVSLTTDDDLANVYTAESSRAEVVLQVHEFQHGGQERARELHVDIPVADTNDPHQIWMCARWNADNPVGQWLTNECQSLSTQSARLTCLCPFQSGSYSAVLTGVREDETANEEPHAAHEQIHQVGNPPSETTKSTTKWQTTTEKEKLHLDEEDKAEYLQHLVFMQNEEKKPNFFEQTEFIQRPQGPVSQKLSSNLITFTVQSDLTTAAQSRPVSELEARIKKQLAQQIRIPDAWITECTIERASISVRFSHPKDEIVRRAVMELVRMLKLGRLDLKGFDNERLRIAPQAVPGYQSEEGGNSNPSGPSVPGTDPVTLPPTTRSTFTLPPPVTTPFTIPSPTTMETTTTTTTTTTLPTTTNPPSSSTETPTSTIPTTSTESTTQTTTPTTTPTTEMTTTKTSARTEPQNPAGGPDLTSTSVPGTTATGTTLPRTTAAGVTTTESNVPRDAEWVDADVYDENVINADQNMLYGVYAGAGTSVFILLMVIVKSCIDLCSGRPVDWSDLPENGQIPDEKMRKKAADDAPLYRPIQYPEEIQAALDQVNSTISVPLRQTTQTGSEYDPAEYIDSTLPGRPYRVQ